MASKTDNNGETRKQWVAPELRKTSIEQITASAPAPVGTHDGGTTKPNIWTAS
jgi:hypothetical protein